MRMSIGSPSPSLSVGGIPSLLFIVSFYFWFAPLSIWRACIERFNLLVSLLLLSIFKTKKKKITVSQNMTRKRWFCSMNFVAYSLSLSSLVLSILLAFSLPSVCCLLSISTFQFLAIFPLCFGENASSFV